MSYIKADTPKEQEYFDYLEELRQSGDTNMFGARPYLQAAFPELSEKEAGTELSRWMAFHEEPDRILEGPTSRQQVTVKEIPAQKVVRRKWRESGI
jgi:hypothetical protein